MKHTFTFFFFSFPFLLFSQSPNFVLILADDMGWNGTAVQLLPTENGSASDFYETPNLQQLAAEGMTFSQGYAPAPKCSPTRNSILTGESTARNSFTETGNQIETGQILIEATTNRDIDHDDVTIAEWLKSLGLNYQTAHFGKWHLGSNGPADHGFDFSDGATSNNHGNAANGEVIQEDPKTMFELTEKGIQFMQDAVAAGDPFYLQMSHYAVHGGTETTQASFDYFAAKPPGAVHDNVEFAGMTKDLDAAIELLLQEINALEIEGETYVVFMSDNGSGGASDNAPLREQKAYIFEGGIRVPFIVKGPGIPAGTFCPTPVHGYDLFPTIAEWTGSSAALPATLDGESIAPLLEQLPFARTEPLYFHLPHYSGNADKIPRSAAVDGQYKLIVEYDTGIDYLYDLDADIGETNNIAAANPVILHDLKVKLRDHLKSVGANMPALDPAHPNFSGTGTDVDNDGLDDAWEFTELLSYTFGPTDDPDKDGDDNLTEYLNGTDPLVGGNVVVINEGGFETGWGIWNDGGVDCRRNINDAPFANSGSYCVRLRDDGSFMTSDLLDLSAFEEITVAFSFVTQGFGTAEDFWLQLSSDGGTTFTTIEDWVWAVDFNNDERQDPVITIDGPFSSQSLLRFYCDASRNNDELYIDDVNISGILAAQREDAQWRAFKNEQSDISPQTDLLSNDSTRPSSVSSVAEFRLFPNPVHENLTLEFTLDQPAELECIITNIFGETLLRRKRLAVTGKQKINLAVAGLTEGYYFVQLISENGKSVKRFAVAR
ncbi:MAG: sulfatase-like hydrolase/transferase [Bacteroidota bacterium]